MINRRSLLSLAVIALLTISHARSQTQGPSLDDPTIIFLVRHAEKIKSSGDPELSVAGKKRAVHLSKVLEDAEIDFIYSSDYVRTRDTAKPVAATLSKPVKLYDPRNLPTLVTTIQDNPGRYLIVGHSNTTPNMVQLLGGDPGAAIEEKTEYDRLYIVTIGEENVTTVLVRYGE